MPKKKDFVDQMIDHRKTQNFDVFPVADGGYYKKYYNLKRVRNGKVQKEYTGLSERMSLFERIQYQHPTFFKSKGKTKQDKQKICLKLIAATSAALIVALGALAIAVNIENDKNSNQKYESGYSYRADKNDKVQEEQKQLKEPVPVTYEQNGQTFISLDSALEISRYNYAKLQSELAAYNKTASSSQKFNFNPEIFDHATFVGLQIKESSLKLHDSSDTNYKGGFKLGSSAIEEANEVSVALTGSPIISTEADLNDPVKSSKACMYFFVRNYEYVHDEIASKNLDTKITAPMIIDEYLYGCGNIFKEINGSGYTQKTYSKMIMDYAEIVRPFSEKLEEGNMTDEQRDKERRATFNKLYQVPEKYSSSIEK